MAKKGTKKQTLGWIPSSFNETDLKKAKKEGFLPESTEIIFPRDKVVPASPTGYQVMFLAFLLRGLSLPAHKIPLWASLCVWRATTSAHTKFSTAHCLLCHPL
jgi:hypothetical protein